MQISLSQQTIDTIKYLRKVPWFENIGTCKEDSVKCANSAKEAKKWLHKQKYEDLLTEFINRNHAIRCRSKAYAEETAELANARAVLIGDRTEALVAEIIDKHPFIEELGASDILTDHIDGFICEAEFSQPIDDSPYRQFILPWYEDGFFPCGWDGKLSSASLDYEKWALPKGRLIIY